MTGNVIKFEDTDTIAEDSLELMWAKEEKKPLWITIDNPWFGDSISGFGVELNHTLTKEQAQDLYEWLGGMLNEGNS